MVLNVSNNTLFLGPAERADVIVDFSAVPPAPRLILYNDAPAPVPAFDPRIRLLHGRPGSDLDRRRAHDPAGLRSQHPDHHAVPGTAGAPAATAFNLAALQASIAGRLRRVPARAHRAGSGLSGALQGRLPIRMRESRTPP